MSQGLSRKTSPLVKNQSSPLPNPPPPPIHPYSPALSPTPGKAGFDTGKPHLRHRGTRPSPVPEKTKISAVFYNVKNLSSTHTISANNSRCSSTYSATNAVYLSSFSRNSSSSSSKASYCSYIAMNSSSVRSRSKSSRCSS